MIEVIINGETIKKFFDCFTILNDKNLFDLSLISINTEMDCFIQYIEKYVSVNDIIFDCSFRFSTERSLLDIHDYRLDKIYHGEKLFFQFPDEETAFYFKLKFC